MEQRLCVEVIVRSDPPLPVGPEVSERSGVGPWSHGAKASDSGCPPPRRQMIVITNRDAKGRAMSGTERCDEILRMIDEVLGDHDSRGAHAESQKAAGDS